MGPHAKAMPQELISLAEVTRREQKSLTRGDSMDLGSGAAPTYQDLAEALHFALGDGRIWLNDQRMLLMQTSVLGGIRQEVIDAFGIERARAMFMRIGYLQGVRDAELIQKRWPMQDLTHALAAGPRVHTLEGMVKVSTKRFEFDVKRGTYLGEFQWEDSSEASEHMAHYGLSVEPVCWMQTGYPSGYTSRLLGTTVLFREIECAGQGAKYCTVIGKNAEAWGDDVPELAYFGLANRAHASTRNSRNAVSSNALAHAEERALAPSGESAVAVGVSASYVRTQHLIAKVAPTEATVMFTGESGVGKELFSRYLHKTSRRPDGPFIAINCAAIPEQLVESELFGVEKGAFTGAVISRAGYFERAHGGTLFLDEVSSLTYSAQGKLLRALQERQFERVGGTKTIAVDTRIVCACNVDLKQEVEAGRFRADLYFRLNIFPITIPPLRERRDDIPLLMSHFLGLYGHTHIKRIPGFTRRASDALLKYNYPGNIRELQNLIERGVVYAEDGQHIDVVHMFLGSESLTGINHFLDPAGHLAQEPVRVSAGFDGAISGAPAPDQRRAETTSSFEELERATYEEALKLAGGNIAAAARALKLTRAKLEYRLARLRRKS
jgi:DNA-binding NtrC family response regulator/predicted hydrocarbon binding protein